MRKILPLAILMFGLGAVLFWRSLTHTSVEEHLELLNVRFGVTVSIVDIETTEYGQAAITDGLRFKPVDKTVVGVTLDVLEQELDKYPVGRFSNICGRIHLVGGLFFGGAEAGGTAGKDWIAISSSANHTAAVRYETARLGIHHECSSIVWSKQPQLQDEWRARLPLSWAETYDGEAQLELNQGRAPDISTGFLSSYATSSAENDFNTYAELLFTDPARLKKLSEENEVVFEKQQLLIRFYLMTDPAFEKVLIEMGALNVFPP